MPYDLFWRGPLGASYYYERKYIEENKARLAELDCKGWINGMYVRDALLSVYKVFNSFADKKSNDYPYRKMPVTEEIKHRNEQKRKQESLAKMAKEVEQHNRNIQTMIARRRGNAGE